MRQWLKNYLLRLLWYPVRIILRRNRVHIVAVTGSAGKTTTKNLVAAVLRAEFGEQVLVGFGNLGTKFGIPLALFGIRRHNPPPGKLILYTKLVWLKMLWWLLVGYPYRYVVLELAADQPGEIAWMARQLKPEIGILTNIGPSHLEYFGTVEQLAQEKIALLKNVRSSGLIIVESAIHLPQLKVQVERIKLAGLKFGPAAAAQVGNWYGVTGRKISTTLGAHPAQVGRYHKLSGVSNTLIIDSSYNANPVSMRAVIDEVAQVNCPAGYPDCKRIFVFGDMLELGKDSFKFHQEILAYATRKFDAIVTVGTITAPLPAAEHFDNAEAAGEWLLRHVPRGAIILVKGSNGIKLTQVVKRLAR